MGVCAWQSRVKVILSDIMNAKFDRFSICVYRGSIFIAVCNVCTNVNIYRIKCMTIKRGNGIIIVSGHAHKCHVIHNAICRRRTTSTKLLIGSPFWPYEFWSNNAFVISTCRNTRFCSCNPCGLKMRITAHKYTVMTYRIIHILSNYTNSNKHIRIYILYI